VTVRAKTVTGREKTVTGRAKTVTARAMAEKVVAKTKTGRAKTKTVMAMAEKMMAMAEKVKTAIFFARSLSQSSSVNSLAIFIMNPPIDNVIGKRSRHRRRLMQQIVLE